MASSRVGAMMRPSGTLRRFEELAIAQKCGRDGEAEGHRLAGAGLGGDEEVMALRRVSRTASWTGVSVA